jgi:hypothetical protein
MDSYFVVSSSLFDVVVSSTVLSPAVALSAVLSSLDVSIVLSSFVSIEVSSAFLFVLSYDISSVLSTVILVHRLVLRCQRLLRHRLL